MAACNKNGSCEGCQKRSGLPIIPVRFAIAPKEAKAPKLSAPFALEKNIPIEGDVAHYTLRQLRGGVLYVYCPEDKAGNKYDNPWRGYIVTAKNYFYPFDIPLDGPKQPTAIDDWAPCIPDQFGANAQFITVPEEAKYVWICFSDVEWTKDVWKRFNDDTPITGETEGCRTKLMHKIDVQSWLGGSQGAKNQDLAAIEARASNAALGLMRVVEWKKPRKIDEPKKKTSGGPRWSLADVFGLYKTGETVWDAITDSLDPGLNLSQFEFSSSPLGERDPNSLMYDEIMVACERIADKSERTKNKTMMVALEDPRGITEDIAKLMWFSKSRHDRYMELAHAKKLKMKEEIEKVKGSVGQMAYQNYEFSQRDIGYKVREITGTKSREEKFSEVWEKEGIGDRLNIEQGNAEYVFEETLRKWEIADSLTEKTWEEKYESVIKAKLDEFDKKCDDALVEFNKKKIEPLVHAHVAWISSAKLAQVMQGHYDENDEHHGVAYTDAIGKCMEGTQDKLGCMRHYSKVLDGDINNKAEVILRAFSLNQDKRIAATKEFSEKKVDEDSSIQLGAWNQFFETVGTITDFADDVTLLHNANNVMTRFIDAIGPTIADKVIRNTGNVLAHGKPLPYWVANMGAFSGKPLLWLEVFHTPSAGLIFIDNRIAQTAERIHPHLSGTYSQKRLLHWLEGKDTNKLLRIAQEGGKSRTHFLVPVDEALYEAQMSRLGNNLKTPEARQLAQARAVVHSLADIDEHCNAAANTVSSKLILPGVLSFVGLVANGWTAVSLYKDVEKEFIAKSSIYKTSIALARFGTGAVGALTATAEVGTLVVDAVALLFVQNVNQVLMRTAAIRGTARTTASFAGYVMVGIDAVQGVEAMASGHWGLGFAFLAGATVGLATIALIKFTTIANLAAIGGVLGVSTGGMALIVIGIGLLLVAATVYIGILIQQLKFERDLQDWLREGTFGRNNYRTWEAEMEALKTQVFAQ